MKRPPAFVLITLSCSTMLLSACVDARPTTRCEASPVRFATFNVYLNRPEQGQLRRDLEAGDAQALAVAEIIQRVRPDVVLLNEFDFDASGETLRLFQERYLEKPQGQTQAMFYPHQFLAPSNTGIASPIDINDDGRRELPDDGFGYGRFPGQYAMALLSRFPIARDEARTFQRFLWQDMPGALLPDDETTPALGDYYNTAELAQFRLSSKSHWDVPLSVHGTRIHVLAAHPTPAVFDGPEDRNGRRNHDEIRLWADYLDNEGYLYDDKGTHGGLPADRRFVIMGDYNADPVDGDSREGAIDQLLRHPLVDGERVPTSKGGITAATLDDHQPPHRGDPAADTSDFSQNLRIDYVLPSRWGFEVQSAGVFWPEPTSPLYRLVGDGSSIVSSDHRLVWVDVNILNCANSG